MKQAQKLKNSAMDCKSQLLAESLAKSLYLLQRNGKFPNVIYSVLCDGLCLHVLIHFPKKKRAYLSHREIEPGHMTCVIAWLHQLSANQGPTEEEFLESGFVIGDSLESHMQQSLNKKRDRNPSGGRKAEEKSVPTSRGTTSAKGTKRSCLLLDVARDDESLKQEECRKNLSTFSSLQNFHRYNDPLPLTEAVLEALHSSQPLSMENKLRRAGLNEMK